MTLGHDSLIEELLKQKQDLIAALNAINNIIYAKSTYLDSNDYFKIRQLCTNTIRSVGGEIK